MLVSLGVIVLAYLIGSVPWSFLVARAKGVADVRNVGSGNVGATNVLRSAGRGAAALALVLDVAKGALAVAVALRLAPGHPWLPAAAGAAAVVGHVFPVWLGLRGGKGVATGFGAYAVLEPAAALIALPVFGLTVAATQLASLGSIVGASSLALLALVFRGPDPVAISAIATAALIVFRHRSNLERILAGTERRLDARGGPRA
jgi:acyl phosphate:glycerol-3-phosphate acyltransferase